MAIRGRGSVLLEVMVLGIIIAFLAAGMATLLLQRSTARTHIEQGNIGTRLDEQALDSLISSWNSSGVCTNASGYNCTPNNACSCTCGTDPLVSVSGSGAWPACQTAISITTNQ